jgi:alpha-methylacyl-CoA racemase
MTTPDAPRVEFDRVFKAYRSRSSRPWQKAQRNFVLQDISFRLAANSTLAIVGESGAGKSTLTKLLLGLESVTSGDIKVNGLSIASLNRRSPEMLAVRRSMQPVFQDPSDSLNSRMKIEELVGEPLVLNHPGQDRDSRRQAVQDALTIVGLRPEYIDRFPHQLSGGQRQRVAIARALVLEPSVTVLDEPVSALDVSTSAQILNLLKDLQKRLGVSYLLVSHDLATVRYLADDVIVMKAGLIIETGPVETVLSSPQEEYTRQLIDAATLESLGRFAGLGPAPHCSMMLADLSCDVVRVEAPSGGRSLQVGDSSLIDTVLRGRRFVELDLKSDAGRATALKLASHADVLIEGMRPGVMERLGIGPEQALAANPGLVYCRMTGWGQTGPRANRAGHDINYISVTGALQAIGRRGESPPPPLNLVGDFGGGSMLAVMGILAALVERVSSGLGQVVDAAVVDGTALITQPIWGLREMGAWSLQRGANLLDGGTPFYDTYECSDGKYVAVGALEPHFFAQLLAGLGLDDSWLPRQYEQSDWEQLRSEIAGAFAARTRDEWAELFSDVDACVTPVLDFDEARGDAHLQARETFIDTAGNTSVATAPRFSRTQGRTPPLTFQGDRIAAAEILQEWGGHPGAS